MPTTSFVPALDTSSFDIGSSSSTSSNSKSGEFGDEDYDSAYFDIEKVPSRSNANVGAISIDTSSFDLGGSADEDLDSDGYFGSDYGDNSLFSSASADQYAYDYGHPEDSSNSASSKEPGGVSASRETPSRVPIRNVLDVFQELKLAFGRGS